MLPNSQDLEQSQELQKESSCINLFFERKFLIWKKEIFTLQNCINQLLEQSSKLNDEGSIKKLQELIDELQDAVDERITKIKEYDKLRKTKILNTIKQQNLPYPQPSLPSKKGPIIGQGNIDNNYEDPFLDNSHVQNDPPTSQTDLGSSLSFGNNVNPPVSSTFVMHNNGVYKRNVRRIGEKLLHLTPAQICEIIEVVGGNRFSVKLVDVACEINRIHKLNIDIDLLGRFLSDLFAKVRTGGEVVKYLHDMIRMNRIKEVFKEHFNEPFSNFNVYFTIDLNNTKHLVPSYKG